MSEGKIHHFGKRRIEGPRSSIVVERWEVLKHLQALLLPTRIVTIFLFVRR
jgi:hypothetical protein